MTTERRTVYRRTKDIYRKAIENIRDYAIFMTDGDGMITNWNVGAQHILGYSEEEIVGKDASKFFTPEDRAKDVPRKEMTTAAMFGRAEDERWHMRRDGSRFWASGVVTPVRDAEGKLIGFSKVMRDMTERNRLTRERDRFFALSMTAYAGVVDRRRALLAGFQTHLAKPVDPDDLVAVILSVTFQQETNGLRDQ